MYMQTRELLFVCDQKLFLSTAGRAPTASVVSDISIRYSSDLQVEISCKFDPERRVENECIIVWHKKGKAWLNSTVQSMGSPPSVIEVRDEGEYLFTIFGKQGNILGLFPVFQEETYIPTHLGIRAIHSHITVSIITLSGSLVGL